MKEKALVFDVEGAPIVGVLHPVESPARTGIVMVSAGGPQYRVGCCRQLVLWARDLARVGYPVLRFDYRGMGDSGGPYRGFEHIEAELRAAIDQLVAHQPGIERVALWGGCNAASAEMMYAWRDPRVHYLIALNPWVHTETTQARIQLRHYYLRRLRERSFWKKLLSGRVDPKRAGRALLETIGRLRRSKAAPRAQAEPEAPSDFVERMRLGLERFSGETLLLLSGHSALGHEFDEIVAVSPAWRETVRRARITRRILPRVNHTVTTRPAQEAVFEEARTWLDSRHGPRKD